METETKVAEATATAGTEQGAAFDPRRDVCCTTCTHRREHLENEEPRHLIPDLCALFYDLKWVTGTGGSISIKDKEGRIYVTPSGVHKERILAEDLFVLDSDGTELDAPPAGKGYIQSQCTPLFMNAYKLRGAGSVIHTHSIYAVLVTMLLKDENGVPGKAKEWRIKNQEMIKGIRIGSTKKSYSCFDELVVPIIENTPQEKDLEASMREAMLKYPDTNAILVRRHGIYVWGESWQKAKSMCECYDYLLQVSAEMLKLGLPPSGPSDTQGMEGWK